MGMRKQGNSVKNTDERQQRFDPHSMQGHQLRKGGNKGAERSTSVSKHKTTFSCLCSGCCSGLQFLRQGQHYKSTPLLHDPAPLMEMDDPLSLPLIPSSSSVPCTLTFNTCPLLSLASPPCLCLVSTTHTSAQQPPTHLMSSLPPRYPFLSPKSSPSFSSPSSRSGVWVDK